MIYVHLRRALHYAWERLAVPIFKLNFQHRDGDEERQYSTTEGIIHPAQQTSSRWEPSAAAQTKNSICDVYYILLLWCFKVNCVLLCTITGKWISYVKENLIFTRNPKNRRTGQIFVSCISTKVPLHTIFTLCCSLNSLFHNTNILSSTHLLLPHSSPTYSHPINSPSFPLPPLY